jgi:Na+/melibiose symporter-like transporter
MGMYAVLCVVFFLITFATTRERIEPPAQQKTSPGQDFADLFANNPWLVMFVMTLVHFTILSLRGGAFYNYYRYFADKQALFDWLAPLGLTTPADGAAPNQVLDFLGWIVNADRSNVTDVAYSVIGVMEKVVFIVMILLSPWLSRAFGKKTIAVVGFALMTVVAALWYFVKPDQVGLMVALTVAGGIVYGPTIPLLWAMFADVADYSEWKTGRRATGIIFATIGFALKAGLSLGAFILSMLLGRYGYLPNQDQTATGLEGIRLCSSLYPAALFAVCTVLLVAYQINKRLTLQIAADLATRRQERAT